MRVIFSSFLSSSIFFSSAVSGLGVLGMRRDLARRFRLSLSPSLHLPPLIFFSSLLFVPSGGLWSDRSEPRGPSPLDGPPKLSRRYKSFDDITTQNPATETFFYDDGTLQTAKVKALARTYAPAIAGDPTAMNFDADSGSFELTFASRAAVTGDTTIFLSTECDARRRRAPHAAAEAAHFVRRRWLPDVGAPNDARERGGERSVHAGRHHTLLIQRPPRRDAATHQVLLRLRLRRLARPRGGRLVERQQRRRRLGAAERGARPRAPCRRRRGLGHHHRQGVGGPEDAPPRDAILRAGAPRARRVNARQLPSTAAMRGVRGGGASRSTAISPAFAW